ncbi:MAG: DUF4445 domain-containing protein [Rhodocyclaceae bacterium]|nr:DUF4445 domain-containing protein [Rhodocyclaceae bacterium]
MATLHLHAPDGEHFLTVPVGQSVRDALDSTELRVRAACGGSGTCGACLIRYLSGAVTSLTVAEYMKINAADRAEGVRLACQMRLTGDAEVRLDHPAPPSEWMSIPADDLLPVSRHRPELEHHIYGVAVDLGTTHIRVALWDRKRGKRIATRRGPNPQGIFGADVLNRLDSARSHPGRGAELAKLARSAIVQAVRDILARDVGEVTPMLAEIGQVIIVGNTAMLALLSGKGGNELLDPEAWLRRINCQPDDLTQWSSEWFMPHAGILLPQPVAGFVGSDLVADLIATGLTDGPPGSLLLDVGTNTEIALWDGDTLHITSVPGGPAFEGVGIRHGMAAEPGAICRVSAAGDGFALHLIGGGPSTAARGLCGSGLADAVAVMLESGILRPSGRFALPPGPDGFRLDPENPRSAITAGDVDAFQRAKAATAAAMVALLESAGMEWRQLRRLCVCGAFGRHLDLAHAQAVGLLPTLASCPIELYADATLSGCEQALLSPDAGAMFSSLTAKTKTINLSLVDDYDDTYINHLRLRPLIQTV